MLALAVQPALADRRPLEGERGEFLTGFNQGWFKEDFSSQWLDGVYDQVEARRILDLTRDAGGRVLRVWLFEGTQPRALLRAEDGRFSGVDAGFLRNLESFLRDARDRGIQVYPTFFSPGMMRHEKHPESRRRWLEFYRLQGGMAESFRDHVLPPVLRLLGSDELRSAVFALDLANEIDDGENQGLFENGWHGVNRWICRLRSWIQERAPSIQVTASIGWPWVPFYSRAAADVLLDPNPHPSCVDFFDLHLYNNSGRIPNCERIRKLIRRGKKPVLLGEFGQFSKRYDDRLQAKVTEAFLENARSCGLSGALAWRLSDIRPGHNPEARYSYEAFGRTRPAYEVMRRYSSGN